MMSKTNFRILLGLLIAVTLLGTISGLLFPSDMARETTNQVIEFNSSIPNFDFIFFLYGYLVIALTLVSFVGLFLFKPWARDLFLTALILTIPGYFVIISPTTVPHAIDELLGSVSFILSGMLIAVMYLSPAKEYFFEQKFE